METINGSGTTVETETLGEERQANIADTLSRNVWDTVRDRSFLIGTAVGAALAVVGVRVAQAYLAQEASSDEPF